MEIVLLNCGRTEPKILDEQMRELEKRIQRYQKYSRVDCVPARSKSSAKEQLMQVEAEALSRELRPPDRVILLDEKGRSMNSRGFAQQMQKWMNAGSHRIVFVSGGAYGFDQQMRTRADDSLSLSPMTCTHQLIRLFFLEQLYRCFTILNGHPYHND